MFDGQMKGRKEIGCFFPLNVVCGLEKWEIAIELKEIVE